MDHTAILRAAQMLPDDRSALGVVRQLEILDTLIGDLGALLPGAPGADELLHQAHIIAGALYHEASGHPNGANVADWYLSTVKTLNTSAARHGLDQAPMPWEKSR